METTVVSYFTGRGTRDLIIVARQAEVRSLWPKFLFHYETTVSALVYDEAKVGDKDAAEKRLEAICDFPMLDISDEAKALANHILKAKAVPVWHIPKNSMETST